jgi:hypothetical protein
MLEKRPQASLTKELHLLSNDLTGGWGGARHPPAGYVEGYVEAPEGVLQKAGHSQW